MDGEVSVGEEVAAAAQNTSCLQIQSKQERQWRLGQIGKRE